jgi:hypothetical protein
MSSLQSVGIAVVAANYLLRGPRGLGIVILVFVLLLVSAQPGVLLVEYYLRSISKSDESGK